MKKPQDIPVQPTSTFELFPFSASRDGDEYLVGRRDTASASCLAISPLALDAITMLGHQTPVGRVEQTLAERHDVDRVSLAPLLQQLLSAGFVRAIDGQPMGGPAARPERRPVVTAERVAWLFGRPALVTYAVILAIGIAAVVSDPGCLPPLRLLLGDGLYGTALLSLALGMALLVKHEFAHVAAGRFLGVDARCRLSHRLMFTVIETDLTGLWTVPRSRRYLAYVAGVVSDLLAAALALAAIWAHRHGWIVLAPGLYRALGMIVFIVGGVVLWQCDVFLRTDGYFVVTNALGRRNLASDAKAYLRQCLRRVIGAADAGAGADDGPPWIVRAYAVGYAVNVAVLTLVWGLSGAAALWSVRGVARGGLVIPLISAAVLMCAVIAQRKRERIHYRLVFQPDL